jgi:hypothetical protein
MLGNQPAEDRIEELQTRVDAQETQLRLLWGLLLYGCATLVVGTIDPEIAAFFGTVGFFAAIALGLRYLLRRESG